MVQGPGERAQAGRTDAALAGGDLPVRESGHACWTGALRYRDDRPVTSGDLRACDGSGELPVP